MLVNYNQAMKTILWCRYDLRLFDNPALHAAASSGQVLPVFIYPQGLGGASYWWLHHSLENFSSSLMKLGAHLILRTGEADKILLEIAQTTKADKVVWNRDYSPQGIEQDRQLKEALDSADIKSQSFNGQLLIEPTKIFNKQGTPFKVFTPFWRYCRANVDAINNVHEPLNDSQIQKGIQKFEQEVNSESLQDWQLLPTKPNWAVSFSERWQPGEEGAQNSWHDFLQGAIKNYKEGRDIPNLKATSYLSPHLVFGEISPQQIHFELQQSLAANDVDEANAEKFLAEIGWREFSRYLLIHFPHITEQPFNQKFANFPWQNSTVALKKWQQGQTGYPIVDAGMRELWQTGYMHNRVRMIAASFLTKHLLIDWQKGMQWFWDTLVDADIANNTASWQWVAGCGADASPYFRIFNPILQGEKFDKEGLYIRKWVPELAGLPNKYINKPWEASSEALALAGVELGENYPQPMVDHKQARMQALAAYQAIKNLN